MTYKYFQEINPNSKPGRDLKFIHHLAIIMSCTNNNHEALKLQDEQAGFPQTVHDQI
jgi:hypothetical protein